MGVGVGVGVDLESTEERKQGRRIQNRNMKQGLGGEGARRRT